MIELRSYQEEAIQSIFDYFTHNNGHPICVLPVAAGKSLTMAAFIKRAIDLYPETNVLLLSHVKELIDQDSKAVIRYWPEAPIGIWSAGLGKKTKDQITVAGIQSIHRLPAKFGHTSLIIIDECHLLSHKQDTTYRRFIDGIMKHNPYLKVIGFTGTEFRLDTGLLTEGNGRLFTDVCYKAEIGALIKQGYLCPLISKAGATKADLSAVHTRGGEYIPAELQGAMDKAELIHGALQEMEQWAADRKHILGFCSGVQHASHCAEIARARGHTAGYVSGDMGSRERDGIIADFAEGRIRILFNANILTTGYNFEAIDCIMMMRPTKSAGLFIQCMGRGLRKHPSKENTLVLDFAGNIERFGPIDQIKVKSKRAKGEDAISVAPVKVCPTCSSMVHTAVMKCEECGYEWPESDKASHDTEASDAVIVAALEQPRVVPVDRVEYSIHKKHGKPDSIKVTYRCGISSYQEWLPINDERSYVKKHYISWCWKRGVMPPEHIVQFQHSLDRIPAPDTITVKMDGKYWRVMDCDMGRRRSNVSEFVSISDEGEPF